jgi:hypothetical protein
MCHPQTDMAESAINEADNFRHSYTGHHYYLVNGLYLDQPYVSLSARGRRCTMCGAQGRPKPLEAAARRCVFSPGFKLH